MIYAYDIAYGKITRSLPQAGVKLPMRLNRVAFAIARFHFNRFVILECAKDNTQKQRSIDEMRTYIADAYKYIIAIRNCATMSS